jgi:PTH1 family peptidyl-tRNA hydrolase
MRIRRKGSAGGHNGLKSIIECLNTDTFPRLKLGVGKKPHPEYDLVDWVLGKFSKQDLEALSVATKSSLEAVSLMLQDRYDEAMQRFN